MTVTKRKSRCTIVETCRPIYHTRPSIPSIAFDRKRSVIDAIGVFVQKYKQIGWTGNSHISLLHVGSKCRIGQPLTSTPAFGWITPKGLTH